MLYLAAFIDIATVLAVLCQYVTVRTLTNKTTDRVPTSTVATQKWHYTTFINI